MEKNTKFILIISIGLLFLPTTSFGELNHCDPIIDLDGDNIPDVFPNDHLDYSYCDLKGVDLSKKNLQNRDFQHANLSGAYFFESNLKNSNFNNAILYGTNL